MGLSVPERRERIEVRLKEMGLSERAHSKVKELSGGLARRAELAKTLLSDPLVLLLDEPTTGLDPSSRRDFWTVLRSWITPNRAILVTTHLMEEAEMCDELIFISEGRVAAQGRPEVLKQDFGREVVLLEGPSLERLRDKLKAWEQKGARVAIQGHRVRVEAPGLSAEIATLQHELGADLSGLYWTRGTLADTYFQKTGRELVAT